MGFPSRRGAHVDGRNHIRAKRGGQRRGILLYAQARKKRISVFKAKAAASCAAAFLFCLGRSTVCAVPFDAPALHRSRPGRSHCGNSGNRLFGQRKIQRDEASALFARLAAREDGQTLDSQIVFYELVYRLAATHSAIRPRYPESRLISISCPVLGKPHLYIDGASRASRFRLPACRVPLSPSACTRCLNEKKLTNKAALLLIFRSYRIQ